MPRTSGALHRVVIIGSGFGGLFAAKSLGRASDAIEVTLIDRTNHHLFQPLLYQVATGILSEGQIAPATRDVLKKKKNVSVELAEVTGFDLKARHVSAMQPGGRNVTLSYDILIVAAGVGQSYFGHDEYSTWAPGMKTLADALDQRARIFGAFEMAELEGDPDIRRAWLTFVVVGGGPTGVEIAGQIAELSRRALKHDFRRFDSGEVQVFLFEGGSEILATFGDRLSGKAAHELEKIGVKIHVNSIVTHIDADGVDVKGPDGSARHFAAKTKIWAAGVLASPLARVIRDRVRSGAEPNPWKYRDLGSMAAVDRRTAILSAHGVRLSGRIAWLAWLVVHITFMTGFKNRFTALIHWFLCFVGTGRCERAIVADLDRLLPQVGRRENPSP